MHPMKIALCREIFVLFPQGIERKGTYFCRQLYIEKRLPGNLDFPITSFSVFIPYETGPEERVMLGCPEGIHYETAPQEHVMLGCPEGIVLETEQIYLLLLRQIFNLSASAISSSLKSGCAMEIKASARCHAERPFKLTLPYSVTTK